ncbi:MAG: hypothetical protein ACRDTP_11660 [Mycobacteriales bacterium]
MSIGPDDDLTVPEEPPPPEPETDPTREADPADVAEQHTSVPYDEDEDEAEPS